MDERTIQSGIDIEIPKTSQTQSYILLKWVSIDPIVYFMMMSFNHFQLRLSEDKLQMHATH